MLQHVFSGSHDVGVQRRASLGHLIRHSTALLLVVIAILIIALALLILFHHNLNATKGYRLRSLEFARTELLLEQEVVNMKRASLQSLQTLESDPVVLSMRRPTSLTYAAVDASAENHSLDIAALKKP